MAFYSVKVEGKKYLSRETYMRVFRTGEAALLAAQNGKKILNTMVFGPLTPEQEKQADKCQMVAQDVDAQIKSFEKPTVLDEVIVVPAEADAVLTYKGNRYIQFPNLQLGNKYYLMPRLALLRVCGKGVYVCLNMKVSGIDDPVVIKEKI